ncbi:MAG: hypothetical protein ACTSPE_00015 [Candidatus Thorarchaeota archaeon]
MKATRSYTRVYLSRTRTQSKGTEEEIDLTKVEVVLTPMPKTA